MCGVVGVFAKSGTAMAPDVIERMTASIAHRGPDDHGYACIDPRTGHAETWRDEGPRRDLGGVLLGHRRLSIVDLTCAGHQPMFSDDRSLAVAFNGEIYNHVELRAELERAGVRFHTRSDTEVLLKAYERWGTGAFARFNGMWAFVLWDGRRRRLVACRDRFGVKPLYYAEVGGASVFASEIKALLRFPGAHRGIEHEKVRAYVEHNALDGDDSTLFRDIWSVSPGTYLEVDDAGCRRRRYWTLALDRRFEGRSADSLVDEYLALLMDATRLRMRADVPVATMLSGGLDSTSITALICEQRGEVDAGAAQPGSGQASLHHAFTACWPGWGGDEEAAVTAFCARLGLQSHRIYLSAAAMAAALRDVAYHLDEPFANATCLVQYLLMERARSVGLKVVINGHGSDEVLAGYPAFVPPFLAQQLLAGRPLAFLRNARAFGASTGAAGRDVLHRCGAAARQWLSPARPADGDHRGGGPHPSARIPYHLRREALESDVTPSLLTQALWKSFATRVLPRWLRMEDRVSMAHSIESRLPFMDYRLVETGFNLPDDLKLADGFSKVVLRRAMQGRLPDAVRLNRQKRRFSSPYKTWLRNEWRPLVEENLLAACRLREHMDVSGLRGQIRDFLGGNEQALQPGRLWRALSAELFLQCFADAASRPGDAQPGPMRPARPSEAPDPLGVGVPMEPGAETAEGPAAAQVVPREVVAAGQPVAQAKSRRP
jgi:asparagine synthase (glutamine-hydrolysing)